MAKGSPSWRAPHTGFAGLCRNMYDMGRRNEQAQLPGKRVGGSWYVHRDALGHLPKVLRKRAEAALRAVGPAARASNVVRFDANSRLALLSYQDFDGDPFPALVESWLVGPNGQTVHRRFRNNPPILHRKELILAANDPRRADFARLTDALEAHGLFRDGHRIGHRNPWQERLAKMGLRVENHRLVKVEGNS